MSDREGAAGLRASAAFPTGVGLIGIFLLSRLALVVVALIAEATTPVVSGASASTEPILRSLTHSDGPWYVGIAANGYHLAPLRDAFHDYVFFPLFPAIIRIASIVTAGSLPLAGVLVSNVAFGVALVAFEQLTRPILGRRGALIAAAFLAFAPGAVAFGMSYTDSLFLLLSLGAVMAAERRSYLVMSLLFGLATLTRLPGIVLIVPLAVTLAGQHGRRLQRTWLWLASGPLALAGFLGYLWWLTGDPLAYGRAQDAWNHPPDSLAPPGMPAIPPAVLLTLLVLVVAVYLFQLVYLRTSRIPRAHVAYTLAALVALGLTARIVSLPRYLAVLWPFPWLFTSRRSNLFVAVALGLSVLGYAGFAYLDFTILAA